MSLLVSDETRIAQGGNATSKELQEAAIDAPISPTSSALNLNLNRSSAIPVQVRLEKSDSRLSSGRSNPRDRSQYQYRTTSETESSDSAGKTVTDSDIQVPVQSLPVPDTSNLSVQSTNGDTSIQHQPNLGTDSIKRDVRHENNINTNIASDATIKLSGRLSIAEAIAESYRREFEDLLERDEKGGSIDETRLYFLELYARRMVGEQLDKDEIRDLEEFETNERHRLILDTPKDDIPVPVPVPVDTKSYNTGTETTRTSREQNYETYGERAGELISELNSERTDPSIKPLIQQILEDDVNSLLSTKPLTTAKKMESNSNIYEIDPPCRLENLKLFAGEKAGKSGSVLRNVDASLYRLKRGTAIHTNSIRQDYNAEKGKLQKFLKPNFAISNSKNLLTNQNDLPCRPQVTDPRVLIAHAGTKLLHRRKSNTRNPANGGAAHYESSRRKESRRQKRQTSSLTAVAGPRRKVTVAQFKPRDVEHATGASSRRRIGEKAKTVSLTRKQVGNRNRSLRQHVHRSQSPSAYNNRRQLAHIILNQAGRNPMERLAAFRPNDVTTLTRESTGQQPTISSSEHNSQLSSKSTKSTAQKRLIASSQPSAENGAHENETNRYTTQEKDADRSLHFLSQLNQVAPLSKNSSTSDSIPATTPQKSGGISKAISILQRNGGNLSTKQKKIYSSIRNERFLMAIDLAYDRIVKENHRLELIFSIAEWRHVHVLMLYARLFQCELLAQNIYQPKEFSIYLPDNLQIFEPLGVVLASIGVVEDKEGGLSYIPVAKALQGRKYKPHDPSDVTVFMEWSQYKWNASWTQVKVERKRRKNDAQNRGIEIPEQEKNSSNHSKLQCWEHLALEMWLGWDEELWFSYDLFVESVSRSFLFVDFPRCSTGTYAWLIPSYRTGSGSYAKIPNPTIGNAVWMISLLFDLSDLPPQHTASWFCKTDTITDMQATLLKFLDSAAKN
mmetsp:Transcript_13530/g.32649  ORF Transcript_13530/g.32649 Transcript_13530/m.32649 type:complete len:958 (-) Transcript_13530:68-2941(-)